MAQGAFGANGQVGLVVEIENSSGINQALNVVQIALSLLSRGKTPAKFINETALEAKLKTRIDDYLKRLAKQFQKEIETKQFDWPRAVWRPHKRSPGVYRQPVPPPLNIVDSGDFKRSQTGPEALSGTELRFFRIPSQYLFTWEVPYAAAILWGLQRQGSSRYNSYRARDWITPAKKKVRIGRL